MGDRSYVVASTGYSSDESETGEGEEGERERVTRPRLPATGKGRPLLHRPPKSSTIGGSSSSSSNIIPGAGAGAGATTMVSGGPPPLSPSKFSLNPVPYLPIPTSSPLPPLLSLLSSPSHFSLPPFPPSSSHSLISFRYIVPLAPGWRRVRECA